MKRILLVDDHRTALSALHNLLELDGFSVVSLDSGTAAIERLAVEGFDAVVTDLEMPGANGVEVVRAARTLWPEALVLVITAFPGSPMSSRALELGARRIISKPLRYEVLEQELRERLGGMDGSVH